MQEATIHPPHRIDEAVAKLQSSGVAFGTVLFAGYAGGIFLNAIDAENLFVIPQDINGAADRRAIQLTTRYHEEDYFDLIFCDRTHDRSDFDGLVNSVNEGGHIVIHGEPEEFKELVSRDNIDFIDRIGLGFFLLRKTHSTSFFA